MTIYELAALVAATMWALATIISPMPSNHLGAIAFNRLRMSMVFIMLCVWILIEGTWANIDSSKITILLLSGFIGIFIGDSALFSTINRLGPRRTSILFSMNAAFATILGWLVLGETLSFLEVFGIVLVLAGVVLAIAFGKRKSQVHQWESIKGTLWVGVALGILAALGQAVGSLIARPVMASGFDPVVASALRVGVSALCLNILMQMPIAAVKQQNPVTMPVVVWTMLSGFLAMFVGMSLLLFAFSGAEVGIVSTLSATTPAIVLPLIWWRTKEVPALGAWLGAGLVVIGTGLIFAG